MALPDISAIAQSFYLPPSWKSFYASLLGDERSDDSKLRF